ncbi:MAG: adenylate/guanylate cyclase domain-containing protein [Thermodesulfobacteriota bacterium]
MSIQDDQLFTAMAKGLDEGRGLDELEGEIWERFGQTCAVLVLDSPGFSRTTQKRGALYYLTVIVRLRRICAAVFEEQGALRWRAEADNVYAEFPTPDAAVAAALAIHDRLRKQGTMLEETVPFKVCLGIGYGRMLRSDREGVFGDEMNLASKLGEDTAQGGETLLTEQAFLHLSTRQGLLAQRRFIRVSGVELPYFAVSRE